MTNNVAEWIVGIGGVLVVLSWIVAAYVGKKVYDHWKNCRH